MTRSTYESERDTKQSFKFKPEKSQPNICINAKNFKLLEEQQKVYSHLSKGCLVNNILDIYFKESGDWVSKDIDSIYGKKSPNVKKEIEDWNKFKISLKDSVEEE